MDDNMKEEIPLKTVDDDATDGKVNASEPNEHAPLKDGMESNHAQASDETWYNRNMSRPRLIVVLGIILLLAAVIIAIPISVAYGSAAMPEMMEPDVDERLSLLEFYPNGARNKSQVGRRNIIQFTRGEPSSWKTLTEELDNLLEKQFKLNRGLKSNFAATACVSKNDYGYKAGEPCVFIQFNIKDWEPQVYSRQEIMQDQKDAQKLPEAMLAQYRINTVYVNCEGDTSVDKEMAGEIVHIPYPGFHISSFPYTNEPFSTAPMFAIHFKNPIRYIAINIECKIYAKNVHHDNLSGTPKGSIYFTLLVD